MTLHRPSFARSVCLVSSRRRTKTRNLRVESLEARALPSSSLMSPLVTAPTESGNTTVPTINYQGTMQAGLERVAPPQMVQSPDLPALANMHDAAASAVIQAWKVPVGTQTAEWLIQLPAGQSTDVLSRIGAVTFEAVPFWDNAYGVKFATPQDVANFPQLLENVTTSEFFYPILPRGVDTFFAPNDMFYPNQWHLNNTGQSGGTSGWDANVEAAWDVFDSGNNRVLGTGVTIGIVDDSFQRTHPDLAPNYVAAHSFDFVNNDSDPSPDGDDNHGTSVAGVAGASGNNSIGVSGAAPNASLAGLRFIDNFSDGTAAAALGYHQQDIDIYNNSWGPVPTQFNIFEYVPFGPQTFIAMDNGVSSGRGGLGNVYVNAAGNSGGDADNVNYNAFSNSRYSTTVAAIDHNGVQSAYSEPGAPLFVSAYSNSAASGITTTDVTGSQGYGGMGDLNYTNQFGGTSSASPLVAGIVALMLDVNPTLSWRDVRHIIAQTARKNDPNDADWVTNGAGFDINHKYGFGSIDAGAAVSVAKNWANVAPEVGRTSGTIGVNQTIPDLDANGVNSSFNAGVDMNVETIEVVLNVTHNYPHDLLVALVSPAGTVSILAEPQLASQDIPNITSWVYTTNRNWGESTAGTWTLHISDRVQFDAGTFVDWTMNVYGSDPVVAPVLSAIESSTLSYTAGQGDLGITNSLALADGDSTNMNGASIAISNNYANGQDFLKFTNQNGITGNFNTGTGVMTLSGSSSVANYQAALRNLRYENTSGSPSTSTRTVTFGVTDDTNQTSNTQARNISVSAPSNQAPALSGIESSTLAYNAGQGEAQITQTLAVSDADSANLSGATVTISSNYASSQDFLRFTNANGITGNFNSNSGVLTLSGTSSVANYQAFLRNVRYENTAGSPSTATRAVTFQVTDTTNVSSNTQARNISVSVPSGSPPALTGIESSTLSYNAGQGELQITQTLSVSDNDSSNLNGATVAISNNYANGQDFLRFTNANGITGNFNAGSGVLTISGTTTLANYQAFLRNVRYENTSGNPSTASRTVTFQVTDSSSLNSNTQSRDISVSAASGPGAIGFISAVYDATEGSGAFVVTVRRFGGTDGAASVSYATSNGTAQDGSDFTGAANSLSWNDGQGGDKTFTVTMTDDSTNEGTESVNLALSNLSGASAGLVAATIAIAPSDGLEISPFVRKAIITDQDGDVVTVKLGGKAGTAEVFLTNGEGPIQLIKLDGTSPMTSTISISVKPNKFGTTDNGRVTLREVSGDGGLKSLKGKAVNLDGRGIILNETLGVAELADVSNGADIIAIGSLVNLKTRLKFANVDNGTDITINNPIGNLKALKFGTGTITAPSIGTMKILGNFNGNITLDGSGVLPGKPTLSSLKVTGNILNSTIDVDGNIGSIVAGAFRDSRLFAGYSGALDGTGTFTNATVKSFKTLGFSNSFQNSYIIASTFKNVNLKSVDTSNSGTKFGVVAEFVQKVKIAAPALIFPGQDSNGDFEILIV